MSVYMSAGAYRDQRHWNPGAGAAGTVSHLTWVLGNHLGSSARAFSYRASSPASGILATFPNSFHVTVFGSQH